MTTVLAVIGVLALVAVVIIAFGVLLIYAEGMKH